MKLPKLYKDGNRWVMDTTVKVRDRELSITVQPTRQEIALWLELHPEDDEQSSVYHDIHCARCTVCRECLDCNLRPCRDGGAHVAA